MTLRTDLIQLANDYGVPGEDVLTIEADFETVRFTYREAESIVGRTTRHIPTDASPVRDEGTPIYDALKAEPHRLEEWEVELVWACEQDQKDKREREAKP